MHGRKERTNPLQRELDKGLEDLRDDCIALFINSNLKQAEITRLGGPTSGTISKWLNHETFFPRMSTIQSFSAALGFAVAIIPHSEMVLARKQPIEQRLGLQAPVPLSRGRPRLPIKAKMDARKARTRWKSLPSRKARRRASEPTQEPTSLQPEFVGS